MELEAKSEHPFLKRIYCMLMGFALENYYKGAAILINSDDYSKIIPDNEFPNDLKEHNLVKLAKMAKVPIKKEFERLLMQLTEDTV